MIKYKIIINHWFIIYINFSIIKTLIVLFDAYIKLCYARLLTDPTDQTDLINLINPTDLINLINLINPIDLINPTDPTDPTDPINPKLFYIKL